MRDDHVSPSFISSPVGYLGRSRVNAGETIIIGDGQFLLVPPVFTVLGNLYFEGDGFLLQL